MTPLHFASQNDNSDHASIVKVLQICSSETGQILSILHEAGALLVPILRLCVGLGPVYVELHRGTVLGTNFDPVSCTICNSQ